MWQREGLNPPESALAVTKNYLDAEDVLGQFLEERCVVHPKAGLTSLANLFGAWQVWAGARGFPVGSSKGLRSRLDERGLNSRKTEKGVCFEGFSLIAPPDPDDPDDAGLIARQARARPKLNTNTSWR